MTEVRVKSSTLNLKNVNYKKRQFWQGQKINTAAGIKNKRDHLDFFPSGSV